MRHFAARTAPFAGYSGLAAAAALGVLLSGVPGAAYAQDDPDGPQASGTGRASFSKPSEIPDDGLKYSVTLPFYEKNGSYIVDADTPQSLPAQTQTTLTINKSKTTSQTIPQTGDGSSNTINSVVGSVLKGVAKKIAEKYEVKETAIIDRLVDTVFGLNKGSADKVTNTDSVTFGTSNALTVTPLHDNVTARPVFYKVKTVADEWMKESGNLRLTKPTVVSDVVVKQGWILECPGGKICRPGVDYKGEKVSWWPEKGIDLPPTGAPDKFEQGVEKEDWDRWTASGPESCNVKETGGQLRFAVTCPSPKGDDPRAFKSYRFTYHIEGPAGFGWDSNAGNGTIADTWNDRILWDSTIDENPMREQEGISANGAWHNFRWHGAFPSGPFAATPKLFVNIYPVN